MKQQDMKIQLEENGRVLRFTGTRRRKDGSSEYESSMERSVVLGDDVDVDKVIAEVEDGVLTVMVSKKAKDDMKPRSKVIAITQGGNELVVDKEE